MSEIDPSVPLPPQGDMHNYRGWLNSDSFWKRALASYGYNVVGSLMIVIPILALLIALGFFLDDGTSGVEEGVPREDAPAMTGKIDIYKVCEDSLSYTDFPDSASAEAYVAECKEGKHPEVIEHFRAQMNSDGKAI